MNTTINLALVLWVVVATLALIGITTAMVWPYAVRHGRALERGDADRRVVSACLGGSTPMDILALYAAALPPPDLAAYADDQIARDPALERLTRRPEPKVRPAVPPAEEEVEVPAWGLHPDGPVGDPPPPATSHRKPHRPVVGWADDTAASVRDWMAVNWARLAGRSEPVAGSNPLPGLLPEPGTPEASKYAAPESRDWELVGETSAEVSQTSAPAAAAPTDHTLLNLLADSGIRLCSKCKGTERVAAVESVAGKPLVWAPCPDCCCPEPGCGLHTGGGFCDPHQDADDISEEAAAKRTADV